MRKIINGKTYNTETAKEIVYAGECTGSFGDWTEKLFLKKTGEYFLYCWGGPMSAYARRYGNMRTDGERIKPMTEDGVKEWLLKNDLDDTYIELFGEPEE